MSTRPQAGQSLGELRNLITEAQVELDDRSAEFVAILRETGLLGDEDWAQVREELRKALRFLTGPNRTVTRDTEGQLVLDPDADPRNADWLGSVSASRLAGHHLPIWASLWLWRLGNSRGRPFWSKVRAAAKRFGCEPVPPSTD